MQWFGESWGAHVCEGEHVATPIGVICAGACGGVIREGDRGVVLPFLALKADDPALPEAPYHIACFLRALGLDE